MAKIVATFDTVSKEFNIKKDGVSIDNVRYCSFSCGYEGEMGCTVQTMVDNEDDDIKEMNMLQASKYQIPDKALEQIAAYFSAKQ